jgi:Family of unknown function (DUF6114)
MPRAGRLRRAWLAWRAWRLSRPFWGAVLAAAGAAELVLTAGMWQWLRGGHGPVLAQPAAGLLAGGIAVGAVLLCFHPVHRSAYSTVVVLAAVTALMADHVGGYLAGTALGAIGGAVAFSWVPSPQPADAASPGEAGARPGADQEPAGPARPAAGGLIPAATGTAPGRTCAGQGPGLTLIRGEAVSVPASSAAAQRPTSALGLSTVDD